ncbi:GAF domain-containing protein [Streptomyces sp. NPDC058417]|uniref:GAF domain-containing protein n=1 Tax=unclassified Streptomyces TaxID=2593676 RepID=UPI00364E6A77
MSQHPSNPYFAAPAPSLPHRGTRTPTGAHATTVTGPRVQPDEAAQELAERFELLARLGVPLTADGDFDSVARDMAQSTGFRYGFVNLFLHTQTFIGLHQPPVDSGFVIVGRTMSREHGWCPEVMSRRKALPLHDVHASPRFSGNHVVDAVGIRSYFGAPLIHDSGTVLGTVCVIDPEPRPLSEARHIRDIVAAAGSRAMEHITRAPVR